MIPSLKLSSKLLIMLSLALAIQLAVLAWVGQSQAQGEEEAGRALHSQRVASAVSDLTSGVMRMMSAISAQGYPQQGFISDPQLLIEQHECERQFSKVQALTAADPKEHQVVMAVEDTLSRAHKLLMKLDKSKGQAAHADPAQTLADWQELHRVMAKDVFYNLRRIGREEEAMAARAPELQARLRRDGCSARDCYAVEIAARSTPAGSLGSQARAAGAGFRRFLASLGALHWAYVLLSRSQLGHFSVTNRP